MVQSGFCPICKRPLDGREETLRFRPFCSKRCADVDLGRWLRGAYAIPPSEVEESKPETSESGQGKADESSEVRH